MPIQVDPNATMNAFLGTQNFLSNQRQLGIENSRNRLQDMYLGQAQQREQAQFDTQQKELDRAQKLRNAQILMQAAQSVVASPDPIAQTRAVAGQVQALGIPGLDLNSLNGKSPEEVRAAAQQLVNGLQPLMQQESPPSGSLPASIQEWHFLQQLPEDQRAQFLNLKRQPTAPQVVDLGGVPTLVDRVQGTFRPLSSLDQETAGQAAISGATSGASQGAKDLAARNSAYIDAGIQAADAISITRRGLELLNEVKTGGVNAVALKASNLFGVTGADEAELSANLGKAVLAQLRSTFGAQFTEREGARLAEIEAGFGKSTEGNRRLLEQAEKILDRAARRGLDAAERSGDTFSANEIRRAMEFTLSDKPQQGWGRAVENP